MSKFVMTIFGASGDLTKRKLMPALYSLYVAKRLPEEFEILGVGRTVYEDADYRTYIYNEMEKFVKSEEQNKEKMDGFRWTSSLSGNRPGIGKRIRTASPTH